MRRLRLLLLRRRRGLGRRDVIRLWRRLLGRCRRLLPGCARNHSDLGLRRHRWFLWCRWHVRLRRGGPRRGWGGAVTWERGGVGPPRGRASPGGRGGAGGLRGLASAAG